MAKFSDSRLERLFGLNTQDIDVKQLRATVGINPVLKSMIRETIKHYESQIAELKDALEDQEELKDRLRLTQSCLIVALQKMGGSLDLYAGQLNEIPPKSVIRVDKLEKGEGDSVPLRISWRPPDPNRPATTDYAPGS